MLLTGVRIALNNANCKGSTSVENFMCKMQVRSCSPLPLFLYFDFILLYHQMSLFRYVKYFSLLSDQDIPPAFRKVGSTYCP